MFHKHKSLFLSNVVYKFVYIPVSEHFSFVKIIHPPDRCGISRSWLNSMIITQVNLVLETMKGHSKMCSFVTQHNATDVSSRPNRPHNRTLCAWRRVGERCADVNVVNSVPCGGGVMVWTGTSYGQRVQLHFIDGNLNAQRYRDEIPRPIVMPLICRHHLMFQHDNARPSSR